ncbi:MAG: CBS domain-containing protein [Caldilineaceae bacterium]
MTEDRIDVILTHEHTDFDALASMLGAYLLYPHALPVLPHKLNRNVSDFIVLYKDALPFATDRDVPRGHVHSATLVDARAVNWIKGMDRSTKIRIIDHHTDQEDGDGAEIRSENLLIDAVGACTTLLVEKLIERKQDLSPVEATLLALGIHEDTGSLTYASTTYRDVRCLAWLMEPARRVNMQVVAHFLSHPLSVPQRELLHTLIDHSEFLEIAGHSVTIAQAQASGFREELSALAARLRDFHETDAIFLLVDLGDIVQMVARSTTDDVDVGEVARRLGGGGHTRAAAAPLPTRDNTTQSVRDRIVQLVEQCSRSAQTVGRIMSAGRPQTVSPDTTIQQAAEFMRRYGHEGFPVIRRLAGGQEELLGMLTRRETDRAMNHGLGAEPVSRFMRAGEVTVGPDESVTSLRRKMVENNWGQVPVVDGNGRIIGIVTRTDLIKLWDETNTPVTDANLVEQRLRSSLPPVQYAMLRLIGEEVDSLDYTVYVVGGFVRDLLLDLPRPNRQDADVDIVIEGNAIQFADHMQQKFGGRVVPHQRFNTAKWLLDDPDFPADSERLAEHLQTTDTAHRPKHLDFVTARTEFYAAPTALPTVESSSIKLDLHRRDFTINTLAICLNPDRWGELLDFYGGLHDLNMGLIRALHSLSFIDDPTRILRAVRYEQRFDFDIEPRTEELLLEGIPLLDRVSGPRIRHELERILQEEYPEESLLRLTELGALQRLHPELIADEWVREKYVLLREERARAAPDDELALEPMDHLYWGILVFRLSPEAHAHLNERLGLRGAVQRLSRDLARINAGLPELQRLDLMPSEVASILDRSSELAVSVASIACSEMPVVLHWMDLYETTMRGVHPHVDGNDLMQLGIPRGPLYSRILTAIRNAKLDGLVFDREQELSLAFWLAQGVPVKR